MASHSSRRTSFPQTLGSITTECSDSFHYTLYRFAEIIPSFHGIAFALIGALNARAEAPEMDFVMRYSGKMRK